MHDQPTRDLGADPQAAPSNVVPIGLAAEAWDLRKRVAGLESWVEQLREAARIAYSCHSCPDCEGRLRDALRDR